MEEAIKFKSAIDALVKMITVLIIYTAMDKITDKICDSFGHTKINTELYEENNK